MKHLLSTLFLLLTFSVIQAQEVHHCGFDYLIQSKAEQSPKNYGQYLDFIKHCDENFRNSSRTSEVYEIPVVFHVVYNTDEQNLSDDVILDQLEIINQDYRRLNPNASETRDEFIPVAADTEIQFYLATIDPDGNPTTGINHVYTEESGFPFNILDFASLDNVKHSDTGGADAWDTEHYLNIWVCNIESGFFGSLSGYAYPPNNSPNWPEEQGAPNPDEEGVVLHYPVVGSNNPQAGDDGMDANDGGRTCTHEVGHYLGLRHIWGDPIPFFEDGCTVDDGIDDTPNVEAQANFVCDYSLESCEGVLPAMIENYMDYSTDACMNMFTQEQKEMMRYIIEEFRPGLIDGTIVNLESEPNKTDFKIYPNPSNGDMTVSFSREVFSGTKSIKVLNSVGEIVLEESTERDSHKLSLDPLSPGIYFIQVQSNQTSTKKRLVKI